MATETQPGLTRAIRRFVLTQLLREVMHTLRASPMFALAVLLALGLAGFNGLMVVLMNLGPDLLPGGFGQMGHFTDLSHRTHDLTFSFLFWPAMIGLLAQLRRPSKNVAGQLMALIPWAGLLLAAVLIFVLTDDLSLGPQWRGVAAAALIAAILHPTWRDFFRSFSVSRISRVMLALVVIAAVPLLPFASTNIGLQATVTDEHALMGHYGFMAAFGFTVIGVGLLASLRPDGWWLPAWAAGLLPALLGITSLVYPDASSSLGPVWALAAIAWGVGFVVAAELTQDAEHPTLLGSWGIIPSLLGSRRATSGDGIRVGPTEDRPPGTPVWVNLMGGIALVVVVLVVGQNWLQIAGVQGPGGGGPGPGPAMHGPGGDAGGNAAPIVGAPRLAITADALAFDPDRIELPAGMPLNVALSSADILHDLVVDEIDFHLAADRGETAIGGLQLFEPGTYTGYCSVPGHREAGMELEIVVTPSDGPGEHRPPGGLRDH